MKLKFAYGTLGSITMLSLLATSSITPAVAAERESNRIDQVAELIASVAPSIGDPINPDLSSETDRFSVGQSTAPVDPSKPIKVGGSSQPLTVSLPHEVSVAPATQAQDGTIVYK